VNGHTSDQATIWRWRSAYQNDFATRMDWTVKDFAHVNHPPVVTVNGDGPPATVTVTANSPCRKAWIDGYIPCKGSGIAHVILAVTDNGKPALTRYHRVILTVEPKP
jgi:hypothetical protein